MIIVSLSGGLGNQIQQYALYRKYVSLGIDARVDISWFDEDVQKKMAAKREMELGRFLGVDFDVCTKEEKERFIGRGLFGRICQKLGINSDKVYTEHCIYDQELLRYTDKYIDGAFVCDQYYYDILPELRENLGFPIEDYHNKEELHRIANDIISQYSVSVHIRRGDYLDDINRSIYGNICTDDYYRAALDCGLKGARTAKIYVFSDDSEYAGEYVSKLAGDRDNVASIEVVSINSGSDSLFDIYLMSLCDCNITANSTFSYWGARLNAKDNAVKIRPVKHKNSQTYGPEEAIRLWQGWILVSPEGRVYQ